MPFHPVKHLIDAADCAIVAEDFDALMDFYADDAVLVVRPDLHVRGKPHIRHAFERIAAHFNHSLSLRQDHVVLLESGPTVLVLAEAQIGFTDADGAHQTIARRPTYVFRQEADGRWVCVIDNSYGTDLLDLGS